MQGSSPSLRPASALGEDIVTASLFCTVFPTGEVKPLLGGSIATDFPRCKSTVGSCGSCGEPSGNGSRTSRSNSASNFGAVEYLQFFFGVSMEGLSDGGGESIAQLRVPGLVGSLEPIEPVGEAAKRTSNRKDSFAVWRSRCMCATWPGIAPERVRGDATLLRPILGPGMSVSCLPLALVEFDPGVLGELAWCNTFVKKREDRLRGGSKGARHIKALVCRSHAAPVKAAEVNRTYALVSQEFGQSKRTCWRSLRRGQRLVKIPCR